MIKREFHGLRDRSEYKVWAGIKQRCCNPKNPNYDRYGGAGIKMCDRWFNSFTAFLADVGARPSLDHSIDRMDGAKGYEPGNCRWATDLEQAQNQSSTRFLTYQGQTHCLSEWSRLTGLPLLTLWSRLKTGKSFEQALSMPKAGRRSSSSLADADILRIRQRAAGGETGKSIALSFGIHPSTAQRIISGRTFKNVDRAADLAEAEGR